MKRSSLFILFLVLIAGCRTQEAPNGKGQRSYHEAMGEYFVEYHSHSFPPRRPIVLPEVWIKNIGDHSFPYWSMEEKIDFLTRLGIISDASTTTALYEIAEKYDLLDLWRYAVTINFDNATPDSPDKAKVKLLLDAIKRARVGKQ